MSADRRVTEAREYLEMASRRNVTALPVSVLERQCADLRRLLAAVLEVLADYEATDLNGATAATLDGGAQLSPQDLLTVLHALKVARSSDGGNGVTYQSLARRLGDDR